MYAVVISEVFVFVYVLLAFIVSNAPEIYHKSREENNIWSTCVFTNQSHRKCFMKHPQTITINQHFISLLYPNLTHTS